MFVSCFKDIKNGEELVDDYRRHGAPPMWGPAFAKAFDISLNFAGYNGLKHTPAHTHHQMFRYFFFSSLKQILSMAMTRHDCTLKIHLKDFLTKSCTSDIRVPGPPNI